MAANPIITVAIAIVSEACKILLILFYTFPSVLRPVNSRSRQTEAFPRGLKIRRAMRGKCRLYRVQPVFLSVCNPRAICKLAQPGFQQMLGHKGLRNWN